MILLKDLFTLLATGEFSNIALQRDRTGNINEAEYEKILGHINLGLVEIYKRFRFLEEELTLHADPSVTTYYLQPARLAALANISTNLYIEQPPDHDGQINIIEIKAVFDENEVPLRLNNRLTIPAIRQIAPDVLKITGLTAAQKLTVLFQAHPSKIILDDDLDPETYAVPISETIVEALLYYVASRVYKPMGANNSTVNADKSISYQQQYELACQKLQLFGLDIEAEDGSDTFTANGWV